MEVTLGEDLETEILIKLSVKYLMRFKCVQRSWIALLWTRTFVTRHVYSHTDQSHERLMIFHNKVHCYLFPVRHCITEHCIKLVGSPRVEVQNLEYSFPDKSFQFAIPLGPCYGLFPICAIWRNPCRQQSILWNPATREVEVKRLALTLMRLGFIMLLWTWSQAFGVDPNNISDLKVLNIIVENERLVCSSLSIGV